MRTTHGVLNKSKKQHSKKKKKKKKKKTPAAVQPFASHLINHPSKTSKS